MTQSLSVQCLDELPVGMDSERWEEKGGGMNNLNGRVETCDSAKQKNHVHQETITGFDRKKVLSQYEQSLASTCFLHICVHMKLFKKTV